MNFAFITSPLPVLRQRHGGSALCGRDRRARWRPRRAVRCAADEAAPSKDVDDDMSFSSLAAGPQSAKRARGRLGSRKREKREDTIVTQKTAGDFIAEGIVDDADETEAIAFDAADIRFGVGDVKDPFVADEANLRAEKSRKSLAQDADDRGRALDVTGDGGVIKRLLEVGGAGVSIDTGSTLAVHYKGMLDDGTVFDSTEGREPFEFELGAGAVIKGWEAGVASMRPGEKAEFVIKPSYAYGRRGMPPAIPSNATLTFVIEVVGVEEANQEPIRSMKDYNLDVARTPEDIAREYDVLLETQAKRREKMSWFDRIYIISPFASQSGEAPPWWLNPRLTFVGIFALVGVAFYLVFISGAIHQGYVESDIDVNIFK